MLFRIPIFRISNRKMAILAMLMAIGVALKNFSISTDFFRIGFWEIPLVIAGIIGGPFYGFIVGYAVDTIYFFTSPSATYYSLLMSFSTIIWGLLAFLTLRKGQLKLFPLILFVIITSITAFLINSLQLYIVYHGWGFLAGVPTRLVSMVIKWPIIISTVWVINRRVLPQFNFEGRNTFTNR